MDTKYFDFLDYAKGLYSEAVHLLEPSKSSEFTVISGSILLLVGMEKLVKYAIYQKNRLMVLYDKIKFEDLVNYEKGNDFSEKSTISFEEALTRLEKLYPKLKQNNNIKSIIKKRNHLVHNFGHLDIEDLERRIQVQVVDFTDELCNICLKKSPEDVFGVELWNKLKYNSEKYKKALYLALQQRVEHYQKLISKNQVECLPFESLKIDGKYSTLIFQCPVCQLKEAKIFSTIDIVYDYDCSDGEIYPEIYLGVTEMKIQCESCNFTIDNHDDVETLLGENYYDIYEQSIEEFHEKYHINNLKDYFDIFEL